MLSHHLLLAALALAQLAVGAPALDASHDKRAGDGLTNAQRIARGLGVARPRRLFDASRTVQAAPAKRSGSAEQPTARVGFTSSPNDTPLKRGLSTWYAAVSGEKLVASTDSYDAASFVLPDFSGGDTAALSWVASYSSGEIVSGDKYEMYGVESNGLVSLAFGTPPPGSITDLFVQPAYPGGLSARLAVGGESQDLIWVVDASCEFYLATSMSAAFAALGSAKALLPATYAVGSEPDFTAAVSASASALVNPARLWATDYSSFQSGYIQMDSGDYNRLLLTPDVSSATTFFAPGLTSAAASSGQNLLARVDGVTYTAVAAKSSVDVNDNLLYFAGGAGSDSASLVFDIPANQAGILTPTVNGDASNWITSLTRHGGELAAAPKALFQYMYQAVTSACVEMVPLGASPQYCTAYVQDTTYGKNPTGFYASTGDGSVQGYLSPRADGSFGTDTTFTSLFIPSYSPYNSVQNVYAKIGSLYRSLYAPSLAGSSGVGPLSASATAGTMVKVASGRSGLLGSLWIPGVSTPYKYYYNPADQQVYSFPSADDAAAYSAAMQELCIETVLPDSSPAACAAYWASK